MFENFNLNNIIEGNGILITIVGYVVVFMSLTLLFLFINYMTKFLVKRQTERLKAKGADLKPGEELEISGEISAAISTALHLHFEEAHDFEHTVLTIERVRKPYSPWSSKLYGLRQYPKK